MKNFILLVLLLLTMSSCKKGNGNFDASGVFEGEEVIVSAETAGRILVMNANEGVLLDSGVIAAVIDSTNLLLQKEQVEASMNALKEKTNDPSPYINVLEQQLAVQTSQLKTAEREQARYERLIKAGAGTTKQLDDINSQVEILQDQMEVTQKQIIQQRATISTQNRSILSEEPTLAKKLAQVQDQLNRGSIKNPIKGTVLTKYAEAGEVTGPGKPLYKIANLETLILRAYITGDQLSQIKLNQSVKVFTDKGADAYQEYSGIISWISSKAEFTPKTIQTKDERANLVYAVKILVKNDGYLKLGMYAEVKLK